MKKQKKNKNYQIITDKILSLLEQGTKPWTRPWSSTAFGNLIGKNQYRGVNPLLCQIDMMSYGYEYPYFVSFHQAQELGWKLKKGSKATTLTLAKKLSFSKRDDESEEETAKTVFMTKFKKVYNLSCIDDSQGDRKIADLLPPEATTKNPDTPIEELERFCKAQGVDVFHGGDRACYSSSADRISIPEFEKFSSAAGYYSTLLHEHAHATGHESRLKRKLGNRFGTKPYAFEELIAELTSTFLASQLGITTELQLENHASYLKGWIEVLKDDDTAFLRAASNARSAADYLFEQATVTTTK